MKIRITLYAAAVVLAVSTQAPAQDDLDALSKSLAATPTPAATAAPRPTQAQQSRAATTTAAPRSTPTPAKPHEEAKPDLSHAKFVQEDDLVKIAGQKLSGVYLIGTFKANGEKNGNRLVFTTRSVVPILGVVRGNTRILVRFPKPPNPQTLAAGNSSQWGKESPLKLERVENTSEGVTAYATDIP